jgi:hypothetical protein
LTLSNAVELAPTLLFDLIDVKNSATKIASVTMQGNVFTYSYTPTIYDVGTLTYQIVASSTSTAGLLIASDNSVTYRVDVPDPCPNLVVWRSEPSVSDQVYYLGDQELIVSFAPSFDCTPAQCCSKIDTILSVFGFTSLPTFISNFDTIVGEISILTSDLSSLGSHEVTLTG